MATSTELNANILNENDKKIIDELKCSNSLCECYNLDGKPDSLLIWGRFGDAFMYMNQHVANHGNFSQDILDNDEYKLFLENATKYLGEFHHNKLNNIGK